MACGVRLFYALLLLHEQLQVSPPESLFQKLLSGPGVLRIVQKRHLNPDRRLLPLASHGTTPLPPSQVLSPSYHL